MKRILILVCALFPIAAAEETPTVKKAPDFERADPFGKKHKLSQYDGKFVIMEWINHGCPYVKKHYDHGNMQALQTKYTKKGVVWLSICSSAPGKQGHFSAADWQKVIKQKKMAATAVLIDEDGKVGKLYKAKRTPTIVILNKKREIVYFGAIDDNERGRDAESIRTATNYLDVVMTALLAGKPAPFSFKPAYGCGVKFAKRP